MAVSDSNTLLHTCPVCQQEKPLTKEFWKERDGFKKKDGTCKIYWKKYCCKSCYNEMKKEKARFHMRALRTTEEGRIKCRESVRRWKKNNRELYLQRKIIESRQSRKELAEKEGRVYVPREIKMIMAAERAAERAAELQARRDAYKAWEWWIKEGAPDWWMEVYVANLSAPWLNPRLSKTEQNTLRFRIQYHTDPEFQIKERMRRQVRKAKTRDGIAEIIRSSLNNGCKSRAVEDELGYTVEELKVHLERQFTKRMSWDKFKQGLIHIDHIIPKAQFDLSDPEEWKACWSLPNLRPLWASDNLRKRDSVIFLL